MCVHNYSAFICLHSEYKPVNSKSDYWNDNLQSFNSEKNEASVPVFYANWTSVPVPRTSSLRGLDVVSFPLCRRSCLIWRTMTNTMTNSYVVIFLSVSIFGRGYHSRYQNFEFTGTNWLYTCSFSVLIFRTAFQRG